MADIRSLRCVVCGKAKPLNQHHVVPKGMGGTKHESDTVTLCGMGNTSGCHGAAHSGDLKFRQATDGVWQYRLSAEYAPKVHQRDGLWKCITITEDDGCDTQVDPQEVVADESMGETEAYLSAAIAEVNLRNATNWRILAEQLVAYEDECKSKLGKREGASHYRSFYRDEGIADSEMNRMRLVVRTLPENVGRTYRVGMQEALARVWVTEDCPLKTPEVLADAEVLSISDFRVKWGLKPEPKPHERCECPICHATHAKKEEES